MTRIVLVQDGLDLIPLHAEQQEVDREFSWDSLVVEGRVNYEDKESCFPPLSLHISTLENLDGSSSLAEVVYRSS